MAATVHWYLAHLAIFSAVLELTPVSGQFLQHGFSLNRGRCGQSSPCSQICEDVSYGYYRCNCWKGHKLARNGYMCIDIDIDTNVKPHGYQSDGPNDLATKNKKREQIEHNKVVAMETAAIEMEEEMENTLENVYQSCGDLPSCLNSGKCMENPVTNVLRCQCPLGTLGKQCQIDSVNVKYPQFWGTGYVAFPKLLTSYKTFRITVDFRPTKLDGLLLFSSELPTARGDFFSVALISGKAQFRFNCGTGPAIIMSNYNVSINEWHQLTIYRSLINGWIQVNDEQPVHGSSQGVYSRITLRESLYLGGYTNISGISQYTGVSRGFAGCIKSLKVNEYLYDMRKRSEIFNKLGHIIAHHGDILDGMDVGECSSTLCKDVICQNGGTCVTDTVDTYICLCPLGKIGRHCEQEVTIHIPSFNGTSYLTYPGFGNTKLSYLEIEVVFRPNSPNGLIIYDALKTDTSGDFVSLSMNNGYLEFRFDCGTGPAIVRSSNKVSLDEWHTAVISRTGLEGILELDSFPAVRDKAEGAFTQTSFKTDLYIGGHSNWDEVAKYASVQSSFVGDIQKVVINDKLLDLVEDALTGINIDNADHPCIGSPCLHNGECIPQHDVYTCDCHIGYNATNCEKEVLFPDDATELKFLGRSYVEMTHPEILKRITGSKIDILISIKTVQSDGLILWTGQDKMTTSSDYLAMGMEQGHLKFSYNLGSGEGIILSNATVNDGQWHSVHLHREGTEGTMVVDGHTVTGTSPGKLKQLNTNNGLYIGGMNDIVELSLHHYTTGFIGCLRSVTLATDYHLDLIADAVDGRNINLCTW